MTDTAKLIQVLASDRDRVDREHGLADYKTGPRRGQVRYDDRYWHGYRDALEDAISRLALQQAEQSDG